jgi:hypothetical protein
MKYKMRTVLILCALIICGCGHKQQTSVLIPVIDIVEGIEDENGTTMLLSEVAEDITFIPLETTDECLLGGIDAIRFSKNYIIVIDGSPYNQIYLFDRKGKFIRKIGSRGRGPCEYLYPYWAVTVNDELFVLDAFLSVTFCYDLHTGQCLRTKKHDIVSDGIDNLKCFNDSLLIYYYSCAENGDAKTFFHIHMLSLDFKNTDMLWEEEYNAHTDRDKSNSCYAVAYIKDGNYYVWDPNVESETVTCLNKNFEKFPAYRLYFGKYNNYRREAGERYEVYTIKETDRFVIIDGLLTERRHARNILYDKTTGKSKNIIFNLDFHDWGFHNDIDGSIPFWPKGYVSQNVYYDYITPERLKKLMAHPYYRTIEIKNKEKHQAIKDYLDSAEEDANPVIFLGTMKAK